MTDATGMTDLAAGEQAVNAASSADTSDAMDPSASSDSAVVVDELRPGRSPRFTAAWWTAVVIWVATTSLLVVAWGLNPSPDGYGTHRSLGLPECGFVTAFDMPCATCGMTTAFAFAADGNLIASMVTQPMGALLAVATAACWLMATYCLAAGADIRPLGGLISGRVAVVFVVLLIAAWIYKIAVFSHG